MASAMLEEVLHGPDSDDVESCHPDSSDFEDLEVSNKEESPVKVEYIADGTHVPLKVKFSLNEKQKDKNFSVLDIPNSAQNSQEEHGTDTLEKRTEESSNQLCEDVTVPENADIELKDNLDIQPRGNLDTEPKGNKVNMPVSDTSYKADPDMGSANYLESKMAEMKRQFRPVSYHCIFCNKTFKKKDSWVYHMLTHDINVNDCSDEERMRYGETIPEYNCEICGKKFQKLNGIINHLKSHEKDVKCGTCGMMFRKVKELMIHMRNHEVSKYQCNICKKSYQSKYKLERHQLTHTSEKLKRDRFELLCEICSKVFHAPNVLALHLKAHNREPKVHRCDICETSFKKGSALKRHILTVHGGDKDRILCKICNISYDSLVELRKHRSEQHVTESTDKCKTDKKKYICDICGKILHKKGQYTIHMRKHTGERPFTCDTCGAGFYDWSCLKKHLTTHTDERNYSCQYCGKRFKTSSHLARHVRIHTGVISHMCSTCGKGFKDSSSLKTHYRVHEVDETGSKITYPCPICNKNYRYLELHMKNHFKGQPYSPSASNLPSLYPGRKTEPNSPSLHFPTPKQGFLKKTHPKAEESMKEELTELSGLTSNNEPFSIQKSNAGSSSSSISQHNSDNSTTEKDNSFDDTAKGLAAINDDNISCKKEPNDAVTSNDGLNNYDSPFDMDDDDDDSDGGCFIPDDVPTDGSSVDGYVASVEKKVGMETKVLLSKNSLVAENEICNNINEELYNSVMESAMEEVLSHIPKKLTEQSTQKLSEEINKATAEQSLEKPADQMAEQPSEQVYEELEEKIPEKLTEVPEKLTYQSFEELAKSNQNWAHTSSEFSMKNAQNDMLPLNEKSETIAIKRKLKSETSKEYIGHDLVEIDNKKSRVSSHFKKDPRTSKKNNKSNESCVVKTELEQSTKRLTRSAKKLCAESVEAIDEKEGELESASDDKKNLKAPILDKIDFYSDKEDKAVFEDDEEEDDQKTIVNKAIKDLEDIMADTGTSSQDMETNDDNEENGNCDDDDDDDDDDEGSNTMKRKSRTGYPFECDVCHFRMRDKYAYQAHLQIHRAGERLKCNKLVSEFFYFKTGWYNCRKCERKFKTKTAAFSHARSHTGEFPFECEICNRKFQQTGSLKKHYRAHNKERIFKCDQCYKAFIYKSNLQRHAIIHTGVKKFICELCGKKFYTLSYLNEHLSVHKNGGRRSSKKSKSNEATAIPQCTVCGKFIKDIENHLKTHSNERDFICKVCDKGFSRKKTLVKHLKIHFGPRDFLCPISDCNKAFLTKTDLTRHTEIHEKHETYYGFKCELCPAAYHTEPELQKHIDLHNTRLRKFICKLCNRPFKKQNKMESHLRTHTGERPFTCDICHKTFTQKHTVERHAREQHKEPSIFDTVKQECYSK